MAPSSKPFATLPFPVYGSPYPLAEQLIFSPQREGTQLTMKVPGVSVPLSKNKTRNPQTKSKGRELTPLKRWALIRAILD